MPPVYRGLLPCVRSLWGFPYLFDVEDTSSVQSPLQAMSIRSLTSPSSLTWRTIGKLADTTKPQHSLPPRAWRMTSLWPRPIQLPARQWYLFLANSVSCMMFRTVFWDVLPCKMIVDRRLRGAYCLHHQGWVIPEDNSEHHTRRRENLKSHRVSCSFLRFALRIFSTVQLNCVVSAGLGYVLCEFDCVTCLFYFSRKCKFV
jgi:hypothetical protein